jgi:hypothetical protein
LTDPGTRKLSAKQVVEDIRSGMDGTGLKQKYGLSGKALQSLCTKLLAAGALTEDEIGRLRLQRDTTKESPQGSAKAIWHCPACNTPQPTEMVECPACGVIVEKFVARSERDEDALSAAIRTSEDIVRSDRTNWMPFIISIVVFVIAGSSLLFWSTHKANMVSETSEVGVETASGQVAGINADQTQEDSAEEPESTPKSYSEVEIGDSKDDIAVLQTPPVAITPKTREPAVSASRERASTPREETAPLPGKPPYITGVLRQFSSRDFKKEVVEASKTYPVLFQFYSQT